MWVSEGGEQDVSWALTILKDVGVVPCWHLPTTGASRGDAEALAGAGDRSSAEDWPVSWGYPDCPSLLGGTRLEPALRVPTPPSGRGRQKAAEEDFPPLPAPLQG